MQHIGLLGLSIGFLTGFCPSQGTQPGKTPIKSLQRQGFRRNSGEQAFRLLKKKYDQNGDGKISLKEYPRGEATFQRLDRDQDGFLTSIDFGSGRRRGLRDRKTMILRMRRMALQSALGTYFKNAKSIPQKAWNRFLLDWDTNQDGILEDIEAFEIGLSSRTVRILLMAFGRSKQGARASSLSKEDFARSFSLLDSDGDKILSRGEFITPRRGTSGINPLHQGQKAPDFNLPTVHDAKTLVRLSSFIGKKPVALIFGSYT
jgi:Ca2+-binding EF-hand superfamily protein